MKHNLTEDQLTILETDYRAAAISTRGTYMQAVTDFELQIEIFIGIHFTDKIEKYEEIMGLIISPRLGFNDKFQIFEFLVDRYHPSNKPKTKVAGSKEYSEHIKEIIRYRNMFAHLPLSITDKSLTNYKKRFDIDLLKLKNKNIKGKSPILTTTEKIESKKVHNLINVIYDFTEEIRGYNKKRLSTLRFTQDEPKLKNDGK